MSALARPASVLATALTTPLGLNTTITLAERAAGTLRFVETDIPSDDDSAVRACRLPLFENDASRTDRMVALATTALSDMVPVLVERGLTAIPLFLALPHPSDASAPDYPALVTALERLFPRHATLGEVTLYKDGRSAFFTALQAAMVALGSPARPRAVLVGGVDSRCDPESLQALVASRRILGKANIDGLLPGEGAGFVLLSKPGQKGELGKVLSCAVAQESAPWTSGSPPLADGVTAAFAEIAADLRGISASPPTRPQRVFSCQTGETYWSTELARAYLRSPVVMPEPMLVDYSAASFGDAGSASGALMFVSALHEPEGSKHLVYGVSDRGAAGACWVEVGST